MSATAQSILPESVSGGRGAVCAAGEAWPHFRAGQELKLNIQSMCGVKSLFGAPHQFSKRNSHSAYRPPAATQPPYPQGSKAGEVTGGDHIWSQSYLEATLQLTSCSVKQGNKSFLLGMSARSSYGVRSVWCEQTGLLLSPEPRPSCPLEPAHSIQPCAWLGFLCILRNQRTFPQPALPTPGIPAKEPWLGTGSHLTCGAGGTGCAEGVHMSFLPAR